MDPLGHGFKIANHPRLIGSWLICLAHLRYQSPKAGALADVFARTSSLGVQNRWSCLCLGIGLKTPKPVDIGFCKERPDFVFDVSQFDHYTCTVPYGFDFVVWKRA